MKIEKLTDNKIRIIVNSNDLIRNHTNLHSIMTTSLESQGLLLEILSKAEKEVGFNTEGCKLLIEAFTSNEDILIFTITKYKDFKKTKYSLKSDRKKLSMCKENLNSTNSPVIYIFNDFEEFCNLCSYINSIKNLKSENFFRKSSLYEYHNTYYLVITRKNIDNNTFKKFCSVLSEFGFLAPHSSNFEDKLLEHGKIILKNNAILTGIKYFSK